MAASLAGRMMELAHEIGSRSNGSSCDVIYEPIVQPIIDNSRPTEVTMNLNINLHVYHHDADTQKKNS